MATLTFRRSPWGTDAGQARPLDGFAPGDPLELAFVVPPGTQEARFTVWDAAGAAPLLPTILVTRAPGADGQVADETDPTHGPETVARVAAGSAATALLPPGRARPWTLQADADVVWHGVARALAAAPWVAPTPPAPVAAVTWSAAAGTIRGLGQTLARAVAVRDAADAPLPGRLVTFVSSDPARATVTPSALTDGGGDAAAVVTLVRGDLGPVVVTATCEGVSPATPLTVTLEEAVATVAVAPAAFSVAAGATQQLAATLRDRFAAVLSGRTVAWGTDAPGVAAVSGAGLVTGVAAGAATITATSEGVPGASAATVTAAPGIATANLANWYRADLGTTPNGATVQARADQAGSRNLSQAVAALQPTIVASEPAFNNRPVDRYDGGDTLAAAPAQMTATGVLVVVVAVARRAAGASQMVVSINTGPGNFVELRTDHLGSNAWQASIGTTAVTAPGAAPLATAQIVTAVFNGTAVALRVNGVQVAAGTATAPPGTAAGALDVGSRGGASFATADVAEAALYTGYVLADVQQTERAMGARYGVSVA